MGLLVPLLFTFIISTNCFRHLSNIEGLQYNPKTEVSPGIFEHEFKETDELGGTTYFWYNAKTASNLVSLNLLKGVNSVKCQEDIVVVSSTEILNFDIGAMITASGKFGCPNENGYIAPIYRQIVKIDYDTSKRTAKLTTQKKTFVDCFENAHIKLIYEPGPNAAEILESLNVSTFENTGTKRDLKGDYNFKKEYPFYFNYDPSSDRAVRSYNILNYSWKGLAVVSVDCSNCYAYLLAGIDLEIKIETKYLLVPTLQYFKATAYGKLKLNADVTATATLDFGTISKSITLIPPIPFANIPFSIGIVVLDIIPSISLDAKVDFSASTTGTITSGFDVTSNITLGVERKDKFGPVSTAISPVYKFHKFDYGITGQADLKVWIIPTLQISLMSLMPIKLELDPYIEANAVLGRCSKPLIPYISFYYGVNYAAGMDKMKFGPISFGPYNINGELIARRDLCPSCGGCLLKSNQVVASIDVPISFETKDNGNEQLCNKNNCSSCLSIPTCGWCSSTNKCTAGTLDGPSDGSCSYNDWNLHKCFEYEDPIVVSLDNDGTLVAGNSYNIFWTGGSKTNNIEIALLKNDFTNLYFGAGLPIPSIANTGSYKWTVPAGVESGEWKIAVISTSNPYNANFTNTFYLNGAYNDSTPIDYFWFMSIWSDCSKDCSGGTRQREVYCINSLGQKVSESNCGNENYAKEESCNTEECFDYPIIVLSPSYGETYQFGKINISWTGGKQYGQVFIRFRTTSSDLQAGYGLPENAISNTGFFEWDVSDDFPFTDGVYIRIYSDSLASSNYAETSFGSFNLVKYVNYTINLGVPAKRDIEIQLIGTLGTSPTFVIPAGVTTITVSCLYIGSLIGVGVNDKDYNTTSWKGNQISISYLGTEKSISGDKILTNKDDDLSQVDITLITCGIVAGVAIIIGSVVYYRRRRVMKKANDKYTLLEERQ